MQKLSIAENLHKWAISWEVRISISVNCKRKKIWKAMKYMKLLPRHMKKKYNFFSQKNQIEETEWTVWVSSYRNHAINQCFMQKALIAGINRRYIC